MIFQDLTLLKFLHQEEITLFSDYVAEELRFKSISYQELFQALDRLSVKNEEHSNYLRSRYFGSVRLRI
jgi:hypothetical protein